VDGGAALDAPRHFIDSAAMAEKQISPYRAAQQRAKVVRLYTKGKTCAEIAVLMKRSRQRIAQILDYEQVERVPGPHVGRRLEIPRLITQGMCGMDMARHYGCSVDAIYADIRALKLTTPMKAQLAANRSRAQSIARKQAAEALRAKATKAKKKPKA